MPVRALGTELRQQPQDGGAEEGRRVSMPVRALGTELHLEFVEYVNNVLDAFQCP